MLSISKIAAAVTLIFSVGVVNFFAPRLIAQESGSSHSAVVLVYHRFGEVGLPSANIRIDQFKAHIAELKKARYTVLPLVEIVGKIEQGKVLPERTIGLTIDDAYKSVYEEAWPLLREARLPFTLFVATDSIDRKNPRYMNWDQIRELKNAGVTIGSQTKSHPHLPLIPLGEVKRELDMSNSRFVKELGTLPKLFAYPYGEYSLAVRNLVINSGFRAAFGQHSGVLDIRLDSFALPRFALNERYGGIDRFRLIANALPLPVTDILPADPVLKDNPPAFGFTVPKEVGGLERLACFASSEGQVRLERLERRVEVRFRGAFTLGSRSRVNCTMPASDGRWRWFGIQFMVR